MREVTAKRRAERKQFKLDRAKAMAAAAAEAEVAFQQGRMVSLIYAADGTRMIPSAATWKPKDGTRSDQDLSKVEEDDGQDEDEPIENVEHLQLTLQEAFFLLWNLDCLSISNSENGDALTLSQIWNAFQNVHIPSPTLAISLDPPRYRRFDNPFLVNYVIYHHYRSLGWVVKSGIKFCVDYLLYKRGPIFAHAEFAIVVCPAYEDPADKDGSPFDLANASPFSWSWLSTINRVNSQVQKV
ncbi:tRNA intron endonuclease [Lanmaoa asiatica]|nr:tRNA intron endonuclease [Lanmaoa asiatica]